LNIIIQKTIGFGINKFKSWRGSNTEKQVEDALNDLVEHPEKYGVATDEIVSSLVKESVVKRVLKTISKYDSKLGKMVDYPMYNNVALGKDLDGALKSFGDEVGANVWTKQTESIFTSMYDLPSTYSFEKSITSVLNKTTGTNQGKILFEVGGVNIQKSIAGGMVHNPQLVLDGFITELELQMLIRNKLWYDNIIFHEGGKILSNEELISKGIKYLGL
jgi:hypothetical protein